MDIPKTAREIGLFEAAVNLNCVSGSSVVSQKLGLSMPFPDDDINDRIIKISDWLISFNKEKYMFLTPEIAIIEEMARNASSDVEFIISIPCDMDGESKHRLLNNLPRNTTVTTLYEPFFPSSFRPGNGLVIISGYSGGDRNMVLHDTYRLFNHYSEFLGKKVFIPYVELPVAVRYNGWMELNSQKLDRVWRTET